MNDTIKLGEEMPEQEVNGDVRSELLSIAAPVEVKHSDDVKVEIKVEEARFSDEKIEDDTAKKSQSTNDDGLKGTALLKSLLSTSTASLVPVLEKMITTTEVTDEKLNLKKILYQPDKEKNEQKESEISAQNGLQVNTSEAPADEDDRRLVIDISDEEKDVTVDRKYNENTFLQNSSTIDENRVLRRVRPTTLDTGPPQMRPITRHQVRTQNSLPQSITYSLDTSVVTGITNSVKIDILANTSADIPSSTDKKHKYTTMTALDELNTISHEIDKQMTKKTTEVLDLLTELLNGSLEKNTFLAKMSNSTDTTVQDLVSISKKLVKRHKFEVNPNHKEFMRMKHLRFPTTSKDIVIYFDNLLPSLNKEKFLSMIKFYEIIIKEMLNLNKTKILQYLIDFMILRKNTQLDLLNYNFQLTSAPNLNQSNTAVTKFQLPDSTQNTSDKRPIRLSDTSYNFIVRSDPIYLQAGSSFVTNHRDIISCRMSPRVQCRSFERRPFDNNMLKGRRIGRRLVVNSPDGDKFQTDVLRNRFPLTPQSEPGTPIQNISKPQNSPPIVVVSDTPPPSLPSEPSSPPSHRIPKAFIISNQQIQPPNTDVQQVEDVQNKTAEAVVPTVPTETPNETRQGVKRSANFDEENESTDPLKNGQITMQEIQTLSQNGTEIIPTSILKNTACNHQDLLDNEDKQALLSKNFQILRRPLPRGASHEEYVKPSQPMVPKMPKRRQSCHERIMMAPLKRKEDKPEKPIEDSEIGKKYMAFLHDFERRKRQIEIQQRQTAKVAPVNAPKRVRFSSDVDNEIPLSPRAAQASVHYPTSQQQIQQQHQRQQHQQHQHQYIENQRITQYQQQSPLRSPVKPQHPQIDYKYYRNQLEHEFRIRGLDPRMDIHQEPNRPLELVSNIPPERYHQHEQQRAHYNQNLQKQMRQEQEKSQQQQQRFQPRPMPLNIDTRQQAAMMAMTAFHQLQSLHRDPSSLTPQQYAEHLKSLDTLKQFTPSAFSAYQRNPRQIEDQRIMSDYFANTQDLHQMQVTRTSPAPYQVSSSSSREDSPNYDLLHSEPSLQRKLKFKAKSTKYVEPNPMSKPFFNPTNSTYYTEPYALTKNKSVEPTSPLASVTAFRPPERHLSPRSPIQRTLIENSNYQWLLVQQAQAQALSQAQAQAQVQAQAQNQTHSQNINLHNQPQRPMPRPAVPSFLEPKINGSSQMRFQDQPTEFLRTYFANQKNY